MLSTFGLNCAFKSEMAVCQPNSRLCECIEIFNIFEHSFKKKWQMKEDWQSPKIENVAVVVAKEQDKAGATVYNVFVVNNSDDVLEGVLVSSKGYLVQQDSDETLKTSVLRHFLGVIPPHAAKLVEPIMEDLFALNNEYLVSFWKGTTMYDKKYIFLPETIQPKNFVFVPVLGVYGVVIE